MGESDDEGLRSVSRLKKGEEVSVWPDYYSDLLDVRIETGTIWLLTRHPITGLPTETEYDPEDLVLVKKRTA